jgi:hypothetical protein
MTAIPVYMTYRCGLCGGDGWVLSSHRGPVLCAACGAPMRCADIQRRDEQVGPAIWCESQNFARGWLGGK